MAAYGLNPTWLYITTYRSPTCEICVDPTPVADMAKLLSGRLSSKSPSARSDATSLRSQSSSYLAESFATKSPHLDQEQWQNAALNMGISPSDNGPITEEARKMSKKVDKRRGVKQMAEIMSTVVHAVAASHQGLHPTADNLFNREPIPSFVPRLDSTANRRTGLLPPRPSVVVGYRSQVFTNDQRELQHGLISDVDGAPRDLGKLSHVCSATYWPFFMIEVSEISIQAACDLAIEATATCNNALMTLASALLDPTSTEADAKLIECVNRSIASFALAIHKKTAKLIVHYSDGFIAETAGIVQTYELDSEQQMSALLARIQNIFIWAEDVRLKAVIDLLAILDRRVNFTECIQTQETVPRGPMDIPGVGRLPPQPDTGGKKGLLQSVIGSSMPSWSRVEM